jgi:queuine/archaeosine tRNA-ribosyltransferase
MLELMRDVRTAIAGDRFAAFKDEFLAGYPIMGQNETQPGREGRP